MKFNLPLSALFILLSFPWTFGQSPDGLSADELLDKSIAYHDPEGIWGTLKATATIRSTRPGKADRLSRIRWDQPRADFRIELNSGGVETALQMTGDSCTLEYQGASDFTPDIAEKYRLNCDRAQMWRDYYTYLYGLPMKLKDPGTLLSTGVERREFHGHEYLVLEVSYEPDTGSDLWYFYFSPEDYSLQAYQFYHDKAANDGEYILLEGEAELGGMRVPASRTWYTNKERQLLGSDHLEPTDEK